MHASAGRQIIFIYKLDDNLNCEKKYAVATLEVTTLIKCNITRKKLTQHTISLHIPNGSRKTKIYKTKCTFLLL